MTLALPGKSDGLKFLVIFFLAGILSGCASFGIGTDSLDRQPTSESKEDTSSKKEKGPYKPYDKIIPDDADTKEGLFTVHRVDDEIYFEIPDSLLGRDLLVVNRIAKGPADNQPDDRGSGSSMLGYGGDRINKKLIRLEKGPNHKLFIRAISYSVIPDSSSSMYQAVQNSNTQPIINALDIKAVGKDSTSLVVEMTDMLIENERLFAFGKEAKKAMELSKLSSDRSFVKDIKSFPENTEVKTVRTYNRISSGSSSVGVPQMEPSQGVPASVDISTLEINSSIVLLPKNPMTPRYYDERVGYFATGHTDYDSSDGVEDTYMVTRWNLEPKEEDLEQYERGELVEPKKPIVYYIDPATPDKWVPYLKQGVNAWQKAFEKAGFKNAIKAKEAPTAEEDSSWSLMDARYSAIVYKASSIPNASGPHINDPRSGEILESHINWYHNVMELARNWYVVQASPSDTAARKGKLSEELMGQLIKYVATHEVGHALGLRHNMGASFATPVEKLRNKKWLQENGHTSSIMDYARFNYVAQPEDSVGRAGVFPRINDYDFWAIKWGYQKFPDKTKKEEKKFLADLTTEMMDNPRLRFISGEEGRPDPRAQTEDLGDNAMDASVYGIENLKFIVPRLSDWVVTKGEDYNTLKEIYNEILNQYFTYINHVIENVGGIYHTPKVAGQQGEVYKITPEQRQKQAVTFINEYVLHKPEWLFEETIIDKIWSPGNELTTKISKLIINKLYDNKRLLRLDNFSTRNNGENVYTVNEYMEDVHHSLWSELNEGQAVSKYRRTVQNVYISKMEKLSIPYQSAADGLLAQIAPSADVSKTDIPSIARSLLRTLQRDIDKALPKTEDEMTRIHLENVQDRIKSVLKKESIN